MRKRSLPISSVLCCCSYTGILEMMESRSAHARRGQPADGRGDVSPECTIRRRARSGDVHDPETCTQHIQARNRWNSWIRGWDESHRTDTVQNTRKHQNNYKFQFYKTENVQNVNHTKQMHEINHINKTSQST